MCGILGAIPSTDYKNFNTALNNIKHRGPDGLTIWHHENNNISLGHCRLSIIDTGAGGIQPMHAHALSIVFNGEIYNFLEIKNELQNKGYRFITESDTEVIIAAYKEWGPACLLKFNGMWSLAIWDEKEQSLFLARDRFGKKPLFYTMQHDTFYFASEMKGLTPFLQNVNISSDFEWCKNNLFLYESTEKTLIKGIQRFPPASYAFYKKGQKELKPTQYWHLSNNLVEVPRSYTDQVAKFKDLFTDACRIRMRSDVPIGTALSGGFDSSATICTMAHISNQHIQNERISKDWQHAFVGCFKGSFLDERQYAEKVVNHLNIKATYLEIDPAIAIDSLYNELYLFEELYLTSPSPMMQTYGAIAKNGVKVSIDGHGADELFSGYGNALFEAFLDAGVNIKHIANILNTYKNLFENSPLQENEIKTYLKYVIKRHGGIVNFIKALGKNILGIDKEVAGKGKYGNFNKHLHDLFNVSVLPTLLRNYDRYSMANGVEIRMPFMDHRLVSYSFSLPWQSKIRNGYTKAIARDALRQYMPAEITNRKTKIGFNTPITEWMKGPWREFMQDNINSQSFNNSNLINHQYVKDKINHVLQSPTASFTDGEEAWVAIMPYFWEESFYKRVANG